MSRSLLSGALLAALAAALMSFSGCIATQQDILDIEGQTDELKKDISQLKETVTTLEQNQADLSTQMQQLHQDIQTFTETVRENQDQMERLASKLDDMTIQVSSRVASIGVTLSEQQLRSAEAQMQNIERTRQDIEKTKEEIRKIGSPTELFDEASVRLSLKNYMLAVQGFEAYLAQFPKGALADVATYKLGRAYYGALRYEQAGKIFASFLDRYPKSELTPSARLVYALCLIHIGGHTKEARQYLESIPSEFPQSPEAKAAQEELRRLSKASSRKRSSAAQ